MSKQEEKSQTLTSIKETRVIFKSFIERLQNHLLVYSGLKVMARWNPIHQIIAVNFEDYIFKLIDVEKLKVHSQRIVVSLRRGRVNPLIKY